MANNENVENEAFILHFKVNADKKVKDGDKLTIFEAINNLLFRGSNTLLLFHRWHME